MNWAEFQYAAYTLTEDEVKAMSRKVMQTYRDAIKSLSDQLQAVYATLAGVDPKEYYNTMIKYDRLKNLLASVRAEYIAYSKTAQRYIEASSYISFSNVYYRKLYAAAWTGQEITVGIIPPKLAELAIYGIEKQKDNLRQYIIDKYGSPGNYQPKAGTFLSFIKANRINEINKIESAITQGLLQGKTYPEMVKSLKKVIGQELVKNGKVNITGAKYNALRIIRTESNRTMNAGSYAATKYLDSQGIEVKRMMVSTLDTRTRAQSASIDGQTVGVDEPFKYPNGATAMYPGTTGNPAYDINDRETVIDIIPGLEPVARIGRNPVTGENEVLSMKDFSTWAKDNGLKKNVYGEYYG